MANSRCPCNASQRCQGHLITWEIWIFTTAYKDNACRRWSLYILTRNITRERSSGQGLKQIIEIWSSETWAPFQASSSPVPHRTFSQGCLPSAVLPLCCCAGFFKGEVMVGWGWRLSQRSNAWDAFPVDSAAFSGPNLAGRAAKPSASSSHGYVYTAKGFWVMKSLTAIKQFNKSTSCSLKK